MRFVVLSFSTSSILASSLSSLDLLLVSGELGECDIGEVSGELEENREERSEELGTEEEGSGGEEEEEKVSAIVEDHGVREELQNGEQELVDSFAQQLNFCGEDSSTNWRVAEQISRELFVDQEAP